MTSEELENYLDENKQFKELWIESPQKQKICALINGNIGWLMYMRFEGDTGYSSRNVTEKSDEQIEFYLSNGQLDEYPKKWTYPINIIEEALLSFIENGNLPKQIEWHDDSL